MIPRDVARRLWHEGEGLKRQRCFELDLDTRMAMPSPDGWNNGDPLDEDWLPLVAISSKDPSLTDADRLAWINDARVDEQMRRERAWHHAMGTPFQPDSPGNGDRGIPFVKPAGGNGNRPANPRGQSGVQAQPSPPDDHSPPLSGPSAEGSTTTAPPHPVPVFSAILGPVIQLSTLAGNAIQVLTRETLFRKDAIKVRDNYRNLKSLASGHDHSRHFYSTITPWLTLNVPNWQSIPGEKVFNCLIDTLPGEREQERTLRERVL